MQQLINLSRDRMFPSPHCSALLQNGTHKNNTKYDVCAYLVQTALEGQTVPYIQTDVMISKTHSRDSRLRVYWAGCLDLSDDLRYIYI